MLRTEWGQAALGDGGERARNRKSRAERDLRRRRISILSSVARVAVAGKNRNDIIVFTIYTIIAECRQSDFFFPDSYKFIIFNFLNQFTGPQKDVCFFRNA